ncbi:fimbrial protein [Pseudomonas schmalbachii]|uniref:Type 1 fimbrial protein n=1 Tax=Pseudomonas schmalbachii TaxID=2816993 RepID=A0ABS3TNJ2_9PSED|nr:fimbrial protein [Pseudomonas schmalbachii]MBO3275231.1 type 1 fimbrial protein [Pseudomonas schmalbachii]
MSYRRWIPGKLSILSIVLAGVCSPLSTWGAPCDITSAGGPQVAYLQLNNVGWPRDAVIGKTFYEKIFYEGPDFPDLFYTCPVINTTVNANLRAGGAVPGMQNVFQSGIPGIGVKFSRNTSIGGLSGWRNFPYSWPTSNWDYNFTTWRIKVELVKISNSVNAGVSNQIHIADYVAGGTKLYDWYLQPFEIRNPTCTVTTPSISKVLPDVSNMSFPSIGSTYGNVDFKVGLNCSYGASLYMTLTDNSNAGNRTNVLGLTSDSSAAGIGFQILRGGNPVSYGADSPAIGNPNQFYVGESPEGLMEIPFSARYIRTERIVTPGIAKGRATFTMSYQ